MGSDAGRTVIFLIVYDRPTGRIVTLREFEDSERPLAEDARLAADLEFRDRITSHEVVTLQAASLATIRRTHARYFEDLETLASRMTRGGTAT